MKVFLMLLMTLVFTHGLAPCQRHQDYSAYSNFTHRHILSENFDVNNQRDWADYLNRTALCERVPIQSFLRGVDTNNIRSICNGQGIRDRGNLVGLGFHGQDTFENSDTWDNISSRGSG
ncbi:ATP-dependent Clp protease ATP-binding subunit ClpX [Labeo rohita]|uniref:ATP-dependent Clp protease ATP-binding subunit ClpX n=1 Tax=Labeo rohita TaxID=84645 RepID=A0ABQ8MFP5_LABRO|nr:ATP-dependent Clp protease ATP-binding subunit ClpX [Labeo rohita]